MMRGDSVTYKEVVYQSLPMCVSEDYIVAADIGGTNMNFGFFTKDKFKDGILSLVTSFHFKSKEVTDFSALVMQVLSRINVLYKVHVTQGSFAAAGVISSTRRQVKPTNLSIIIDLDDIVFKTSLKIVVLANDFEVISYGINYIKPSKVVVINKGKAHELGIKVIIGAGTGLGRATLLWNRFSHRYESLASEGGHADFVVHTSYELAMMTFIKQQEGLQSPLSWEDLLSGNGIHRLYNFFVAERLQKSMPQEIAEHVGPLPDEIFAMRHQDQDSWRTYATYAQFYGRCAKNMVLETLALSGLYIAGGIAAHNVDLFRQSTFMHEFLQCGKHSSLLRNVPLYVITDYNVSLYGAVAYYLSYL